MSKNVNKEKAKVLTLEDLLAKKEIKEKSEIKFKDIYVKSLDGKLKFEKPLKEDLFECMDCVEDGRDTESIYNSYGKLIYKCCPVLKNKELQEAYGAKFDEVVDKIFSTGEVLFIGNELLAFGGISIDEIKNS